MEQFTNFFTRILVHRLCGRDVPRLGEASPLSADSSKSGSNWYEVETPLPLLIIVLLKIDILLELLSIIRISESILSTISRGRLFGSRSDHIPVQFLQEEQNLYRRLFLGSEITPPIRPAPNTSPLGINANAELCSSKPEILTVSS
jgi:hypothetical protein